MWSDTPQRDLISVDGKTSRRGFLIAALSAPVALAAFGGERRAWAQATPIKAPYQLPKLPYAFNALEPHIDAQTMEIHHDRHHAAYVKNLNDAIAKAPELGEQGLTALLKDLDKVPEGIRAAVRNNGGGHVNHTMFWEIMRPGGGGAPTGAIADAINGGFGSFEKFTEAFNDAGAKRFGSGWVWLIQGRDGKLQITSTPNQDTPLMEGIYPILGNDVWEHAYYLKYQNRRPDYLKAWWNVVNWDVVNQRFAEARKAA